jgi:hypothetical protein
VLRVRDRGRVHDEGEEARRSGGQALAELIEWERVVGVIIHELHVGKEAILALRGLDLSGDRLPRRPILRNRCERRVDRSLVHRCHAVLAAACVRGDGEALLAEWALMHWCSSGVRWDCTALPACKFGATFSRAPELRIDGNESTAFHAEARRRTATAVSRGGRGGAENCHGTGTGNCNCNCNCNCN